MYAGWQIVFSDYNTKNPPFSSSRATRNGTAFGNEPATGSFPGQPEVSGYQGKRFVNTKRRNLGTFVGELQSNVFTIKGERIDFLIGGGDFEEQTCIRLFVRGDTGRFEMQRTASGERNYRMVRRDWDVAEFTGRRAYLQILDYAPVEPWGFNAAPRYPEDDYGFILIDDIRQTDQDGNRVCPGEDRACNFDFETVLEPSHPVRSRDIEFDAEPDTSTDIATRRYRQVFEVGETGSFTCDLSTEEISQDVTVVEQCWSYDGAPLSGVKLELRVKLPISVETRDFYMIPGLLYDGNPTAEACHYLGEDLPEDAATIPAGFAIEDDQRVFGGWADPQANRLDPLTSLRLEEAAEGDSHIATFSIPESSQFGRRLVLDLDRRISCRAGWSITKRFYIYHGDKISGTHLSNRKQGYAQVVSACWETLYPRSKTNPQHTLMRDFEIRLDALLDPYSLIQEITKGGRTYRLFYVGRWILPSNFDFAAARFVPKEYFHAYTGFSWSGMAGLVSYEALKSYLKTGDAESRRVAEDTMDFFVDHGMAPVGMLYPTYHEDWAGIEDKFGTYFDPGNIDMGPLGEGLFWYVRCYELMRENDLADKVAWLESVRRSLDSIMRLFPDGDVPGRIDGTTGDIGVRSIEVLYWVESAFTKTEHRSADISFIKPSERGATNFVYLIWAFVAFYRNTKEAVYLEYAERMGDLAVDLMERYNVFAGSEMDFYNIDKRQGHALMDAFLMLYEATNADRWLEAARFGANWFSTWQYAYNVCYDGMEELPLGYFDYRTIGGTTVDIKYSTNNLVYEQGAGAFLRLWEYTGETAWFERARALLHQGTQTAITDKNREWLNTNYQGPVRHWMMNSFNPNGEFDPHSLGGGTEDVLAGWPYKGNWTSKRAGILSMYMLAEGLCAGELIERYGSITVDWEKRWVGAIDSLEIKNAQWTDGNLVLTVQSIVDEEATYGLRLWNMDDTSAREASISVDGRSLAETSDDARTILGGAAIVCEPGQTVTISVTVDRR